MTPSFSIDLVSINVIPGVRYSSSVDHGPASNDEVNLTLINDGAQYAGTDSSIGSWQ